jgi:hypothetical protein
MAFFLTNAYLRILIYFLAESTLAFKLSFEDAVESIVFLVESITIVEESVFTVVESVVVVVLEEPLHAAKAPTAKIANNFFIVNSLFMNDLLVNTWFGKK